MLFRYDHIQEQRFTPSLSVPPSSPARLTLDLVRFLSRWFHESHRTLHQTGSDRLQIGFPDMALPTGDFGETYGLLLARIGRDWPLQCFALSDSDELVGLTFTEQGDTLLYQQQNLSGRWYEDLQDLYLDLTLPNAEAADCMGELLEAIERDPYSVVALDWKYRSFLESQQLAGLDTTLSFCYVSPTDETGTALDRMTLPQKQLLWRRFLRGVSCPPEFEWVWRAYSDGALSDWMEWSLALYQVLEELGYQLVSEAGRFQLLDPRGRRIYFSVEHQTAAEKVFMKILFPLNH